MTTPEKFMSSVTHWTQAALHLLTTLFYVLHTLSKAVHLKSKCHLIFKPHFFTFSVSSSTKEEILKV